ncbi:DUF6216 family protein [Pseudoduganella chitinolytica]|uniref:DUF6216 family protein n=1 Tax=Pseudoduganella chitinolytica TaxID=34070 RepID=A0ABY8BHH2_9BURK|nr:DUF6216 family protein [Pseudoduganella chitinolytica]WEF35345.1 DUF6216 family protein [Pseudoduganella chitinolytica]
MDSHSTIAGILGYLGSWGIGLPGLALVLTAFVIWRRTRSSHILLTRLWRLFHGKSDCKVPAIGDFLDEQTAIHQFRFTTGIQIRNVQQARRLATLFRDDSAMLNKIAAAGPHFDLDAMQLRPREQLPRLFGMACASLAYALAAWSLVAVLVALTVDRAFLRITATGTWLTLDTNYAKPMSERMGFRLDACKPASLPPDTGGFSPEEAAAICRAFGAPDNAPFIRTSIQEQRWMLGVLLVLLAYLIAELHRWLAYAKGARALKRRLDTRPRDSPSTAAEE